MLILVQFGVCVTSIELQPLIATVPIAPVPTTPLGYATLLKLAVTVPTAPTAPTPVGVTATRGVTASTAPVPSTPVTVYDQS